MSIQPLPLEPPYGRPEPSVRIGRHASGMRAHMAQLDRVITLARSYGKLRRCEPHQALVIRRAAEFDRKVLPRWQRHGDGIHPTADPQQYGHTQGWASRDHWLQVVVPAALKATPEVLAAHKVTDETFTHWARTISLYAYAANGRQCIVRPDRLAELMEMSLSTVHRCQRVAVALELYVVIIPGRMLTFEETRTARDRGSRQRGLSNEAALAVPAVVQEALDSKRPALRLVGKMSNDTPTSGSHLFPFTLSLHGSLEPRSAGKTGAPPAPWQRQRHAGPHGRPKRRRARTYDAQTLSVARELTLELSWLRGVSPGRLEPGLRRFAAARAPWTALDIVNAINTANHRLRRASMTRHRVLNPPALLAHYLRDLDPQADHPLGPDYVAHPTPRHRQPSSIQQANAERIDAEQARRESTPEVARQAVAHARAMIRQAREDNAERSGQSDDGAK